MPPPTKSAGRRAGRSTPAGFGFGVKMREPGKFGMTDGTARTRSRPLRSGSHTSIVRSAALRFAGESGPHPSRGPITRWDAWSARTISGATQITFRLPETARGAMIGF